MKRCFSLRKFFGSTAFKTWIDHLLQILLCQNLIMNFIFHNILFCHKFKICLYLVGHDFIGCIKKKKVCTHIFCILEAPLIKHIVLALSSAYQNKWQVPTIAALAFIKQLNRVLVFLLFYNSSLQNQSCNLAHFEENFGL